MSPPDAAGIDETPFLQESPVFNEPWEAQAFAMAVALHRAGCFTWGEWTIALGAQIARPDRAEASYYEHWLAALEGLVAEKRLLAPEDLARRREAWRKAAAATPHGQPIVLGAAE